MTTKKQSNGKPDGLLSGGMFNRMLLARIPCIWVVTTEELRVERAIGSIAGVAGKTPSGKVGYKTILWDCASGAHRLDGENDGKGSEVVLEKPKTHPFKAFERISNHKEREVWVLRDLDRHLKDPGIERGLKTLIRQLREPKNHDRLAVIVILTTTPVVPVGLQGSVTVLDWELPDRDQLGSVLSYMLECNSSGTLPEGSEPVIDAAMGMTAQDLAESVLLSMVAHKGKILPSVVATQKKAMIDRTKVLTWYDPDPRGLDSVGGYKPLKRWLEKRRQALSLDARAYGLPAPKGVLLAGVSGCGKSLVAKATASAWGIPLLKMDLGALRGRYVGESEANLRVALSTAEAVAPCLIWLDEIEKTIAAGEGRQDSGASADALGTILTWLQEKKGTVFIVATCNRVEALPPEFMRKGRFDEIFFINLPTATERREIFRATLLEYKQSSDDFDLDLLAKSTQGFSGAEIAATVPDGMFTAYGEKKRTTTTADIIEAIGETVPLSKSAEDETKALQQWAKTRARNASDPELDPEPMTGGDLVEFED